MGKVLEFKKKEQIDPIALKADCVINELRFQLRTLESHDQIKTLLLLVFAELAVFLFSLQCFQDPRVALSSGLNKLFDTWCKSKKKKDKV